MFIKFVKYQLYLLQLENYELGRFLKLLFKKDLWSSKREQRKNLVWTVKAILIFVLSQFLILLSVAGAARVIQSSILENWAGAAIVFFGLLIIFNLFGFIFLIFAVIVFTPFDALAKAWVIGRAKSKINNLKPKIKIIGIAGSYGKTTMKEALGQVLGIRYKVLSTPESVNTPLGIARWILKLVDESVQIVIIEMGEHYKGDVEEICKIAKPDVSVVTGINEAHLERLKNLDTAISTIFEIVSYSKPGALVVLNGNDKRVMESYKGFIWPDHKVIKYQKSNIKYQKFNAEKFGWEIEHEELGKVFVELLGEYAMGNIDAAIKIGQSLGMGAEEIRRGIGKIKPVEHRLKPIKTSGNVLVIDDAYNGNPDGVKEAIKTLSRFTNRRKVFITPGLVEMGKTSEDVHREIGKQLAGVADVVVLIKNSVTPCIADGISDELKVIKLSSCKEKRETQIIWFNTAQEAHSSLGQILKPGDVVMFQNDWGDQYL